MGDHTFGPKGLGSEMSVKLVKMQLYVDALSTTICRVWKVDRPEASF